VCMGDFAKMFGEMVHMVNVETNSADDAVLLLGNDTVHSQV
jgi:hypothetical protein